MNFCNRRYFILFLIFFTYSVLCAEEYTDLYELTGEPEESDLALTHLAEEPLNINKASRSELEMLVWLSNSQIEDIILYRKHNNILHRSQLEEIGIGKTILDRISRFISYKQAVDLNIINLTRIDYAEKDHSFRSCLKTYNKTLLNYGSFSAGFIAQKDSGERDLIDFYSYFISGEDLGIFKKIIVGKYQLKSGQGILFNSKLGSSKSTASTSSPLKKRSALKPYTSSYESWALEGASTEISIGNLKFTPFYSVTKLSATLADDKISSFNESGLHYNKENKNNVSETIKGAQLEVDSKDHLGGILFSRTSFSLDFADPDIQQQYSAFSCYTSLFKMSAPISAEVAFAAKKWSGIIAFRAGNADFRQLFLYRHYQNGFPDWHGNPFSSQSSFDNQQGFYYGLTLKLFGWMKLNFYVDLWKYPETRYFEKMPTAGNELMLNVEYRLPDKNKLVLLFKQKNSEKYFVLDIGKIRNMQKNYFRLDWKQETGHIQFCTRISYVTEYISDDKYFANGLLLAEILKFRSGKVSCTCQVAGFSSNLLLYLYEYDVDGKMSTCALKHNDTYYNFLISYRLFPYLTFQFKISGLLANKDKSTLCFQIKNNF